MLLRKSLLLNGKLLIKGIMDDNSRLIITKIKLHNFKSFYGTVELENLHPQFSSIVGANGSGKSNVIDALLFVFGFRAKQIRQSKLVGLIHHSAAHPDLRDCYVTISFARVNENHEIIPNTEFSIKRDLHSNGDNNYYMNKSKVKRNDVTSFLLKEGVDLNHNRFLILQGEVRNISLMKPMATNQNQIGFLEYIEDIIGSNQYIDAIKGTEEALAAKNEERDQVAERYSLSLRDLDALKDSRNEAMSFLKLQDRLHLVDAKRIHNNVEKLQSRIQEIMKDMGEIEGEIQAKKDEKEAIKAKGSGDLAKITEKENELSKTVQPQLDKAQSDLAKLENENTVLETEIDGVKHTISECTKKIESAEKEIIACTNVIETKNASIKSSEEKINSANEKLQIAKEKLEVKTQEVKEEIDKLQVVLQNKKEEYADKNTEFLQIDNQIRQSKDEISAINRKYEESRRLREEKEHAIETIERKINDLENQINEKEQMIDSSRREKENAENFINEHLPILDEIKNQAKDKAVEVNQMERQLAKNPAKSRLFDCVNNYKIRTNNSNIYDKLSALAHIDEEFNIPITAAAGNKLDYIVVETVDDANLCIDELRAKGAGYGNFIVLSEQEKFRPRIEALLNSPDPDRTCLILRKLKFDSEEDRYKFITAFYFIFRETLIAENTEIAKKVGYDDRNRRRVVDMDGVIVDVSGTMNGGGDMKTKGGMQSFSKKDLEEGRNELEKLDNEINNLTQQIYEQQRCLKRININALEVELQKLRYDLEQNQSQIEYFKEQLRSMPDTVWTSDDLQKVQDCQAFINEHGEELNEKRKVVEQLKSECQSIETEISEIVSKRTQSEKEEIKKIEQEIEKYSKSKAQDEAAIKSAQRKLDKSQKILNDNKTNKEESSNGLNELTEKLEKKQKEKEEKQNEVNQFTESASNLENEIKELRELDRKSKSESNKLDLEIEGLESDLNKKKKELKENQKQEEQYQAQLNKLEVNENEFDEFENKTSQELELERAAIETKLASMDPNLSVLKEYEEKEAICKKHYDEFQDISNQRNEILAECKSLKNQRLEKFLKGFEQIKETVKETYQILTLGGDAELDLVDTLDPFSQGINFSVRPPGKSWKLISNLSGGEQTLSSLSLVFALHQFKPTPFYIMDEIDAALDIRNVAIIANYLKERTTNAQFIVVSLRNQMFELADKLVGIYKVTDCAKALTIGFDAEEHDQEEEKAE